MRRNDRKKAKHVEEEIEVGNAPGDAWPDSGATERAGELWTDRVTRSGAETELTLSNRREWPARTVAVAA
ncbi:hypothetical protein [Methylobacterium sp. GC_Met_2]|uniref:hypothetical protein n=1 Tax=Methylobacterium sp. GC_Met_2 TaxID=2937376 RepID=UPI00226B19B0|nr:hypothetical protein [Methylobacterium sp. GC_Met_2]